jgi:fluoroacetyl-CoA thioesterase
MKTKPKIGTTGSKHFNVEPAHAIDFAGGALPAVLSTPTLIRFLEMTARETVLPFLDEGEVTLGTSVELTHFAPTPVGENVTCQVRVVQVDGPKIAFQIEAHDRQERIAKGFHTRVIVEVERFAKRVSKKG